MKSLKGLFFNSWKKKLFYFSLAPEKCLYYNYKMGVVYPDMGVVGNLE